MKQFEHEEVCYTRACLVREGGRVGEGMKPHQAGEEVVEVRHMLVPGKGLEGGD